MSHSLPIRRLQLPLGLGVIVRLVVPVDEHRRCKAQIAHAYVAFSRRVDSGSFQGVVDVFDEVNCLERVRGLGFRV